MVSDDSSGSPSGDLRLAVEKKPFNGQQVQQKRTRPADWVSGLASGLALG